MPKSQPTDLPPDGTWCLVRVGDIEFPAMALAECAGGWSSAHGWEDFDGDVDSWRLLEGIPLLAQAPTGKPFPS